MPVIRQPFQVTRLAFTQRIMPTEAIGRELGVSGRAVRYWLTGERGIAAKHLQPIQRLYERTQYGIMRQSGLSATQSAKYRGLYPDTFDIWKGKLDDLVYKWRGRAILTRLHKAEIEWDDLTEDEKDEWLMDVDQQVRDEIDQSDKGIDDLERY